MELLDTSKAKVATIDETTAFVRAWGKNGNVFGFYNSKQAKGEVTERKLTAYKIEGLVGYYIKTDSGKEIELGTDVDAIPGILANVGITVGVVSGVNSDISDEAVESYAKADTSDKASVDIIVKINLPSDATDSASKTVTLDKTELTVKFKRSVNAVTVNDVINYMNSYDKIPSITSHMIIGASAGETGAEESMLSVKDALLEDQTITLVWGKAVALKWVVATTTDGTSITEDATNMGSVNIPYTYTLAEAIDVLKENKDVVAKAYNFTGDGKYSSMELLGEYSKTSGKAFTKAELRKNVNSFESDTVQIVWKVVEATETKDSESESNPSQDTGSDSRSETSSQNTDAEGQS